MLNDDLDILFKTTGNATMSLEQSKKFSNTKRKINSICKALTLQTQKYDPQRTVENINTYIASMNKLDRILYSEISNYVFSLEMPERGIFTTNLEKLLLYSLDDKNTVNSDSKKLIIKIYDHSQLALHQIVIFEDPDIYVVNMGRAFEAKNQSMGLKINRRIKNSIRKTLTKKRLPGDFGSRFWKRCRMCHTLHQYKRNILQNVTKNSIKF